MRNVLDNAPDQSYKFKTKKWVGVNYNLHGTFSADSQIKLKTSMLRSSF